MPKRQFRKTNPRYLPYARKVARFAGEVGAYSVGGSVGQSLYNAVVPKVKDDLPMAPSYGNGTLTSERRRYGRKQSRKSSKYVKRLVIANVCRRVYGYDAWSQMYGVSGYNRLENYYRSATDITYYTPLHLYDVSAVLNAPASTPAVPQIGYRLCFLNTTGAVQWRTLGPAAVQIRNDNSAAFTAGNPMGNDVLSGVKVKTVCYAPTTIPVKFTLAFIQIGDQKYHPSKNAGAGGTGNIGAWQADNTVLPNDNGASITSQTALWQSVVQAAVRSPCAIGDGNLRNKNIKILAQRQFTLQPKESTDPANTTYHATSMYMSFNRKQNYQWEDDATLQLDADRSVQANAANVKCCVHPKARIYFMVMADAKYSTGTTAPADTPTIWPSYDIAMRMYHEDLR